MAVRERSEASVLIGPCEREADELGMCQPPRSSGRCAVCGLECLWVRIRPGFAADVTVLVRWPATHDGSVIDRVPDYVWRAVRAGLVVRTTWPIR